MSTIYFLVSPFATLMMKYLPLPVMGPFCAIRFIHYFKFLTVLIIILYHLQYHHARCGFPYRPIYRPILRYNMSQVQRHSFSVFSVCNSSLDLNIFNCLFLLAVGYFPHFFLLLARVWHEFGTSFVFHSPRKYFLSSVVPDDFKTPLAINLFRSLIAVLFEILFNFS